MKIRKTLGIDLGTTNSVLALADPTDSALVPAVDERGRQTIPSAVAHHAARNRPVAGWAARDARGSDRPPALSVKRHMGLERRFAVGEERLTPREVSALILAHARDLMAATLNDPRYLLDSAVLTMPAYFNHNQIEDTRRAGELAGFEVVELLHEPTAAAIYYSWLHDHGDAAYLVYDLGGGTFDVSVIRRRFGDYEVLSVSGDPFLGGDDFDRLLATAIGDRLSAVGCQPSAEDFARLVHVAEEVKVELSVKEEITDITERSIAAGWLMADSRKPIAVRREEFQGLIKDKVHRTIDCCHEALARAKEKCGLSLGDIDYVILVGGSSRIPYVRATVRAAFCNEALPEHVRCPEPLLHEPDLCVAYGAALRGATHGTRYVFPVARRDAPGLLPDIDIELSEGDEGPHLELHWTSPVNVRDARYMLTGAARGPGAAEVRHGGSLRVHCFTTGLTEEVFLDEEGGFAHEFDLQPEADNALEVVVCDNLGQELVRIPACVRHRLSGADRRGTLGPGVLPTQLITKPLAIEVLDRGRQRVKRVVAPVGAALPGVFRCTCRTVDQSSRIIVPVLEENRVIKQLAIDELDPSLPVGSPVEVEFHIDVKHTIEVRVNVRAANRCESITLEGPPPPRVPTPAEIDEARTGVEELLQQFTGSQRTRAKARLAQLLIDLREARFYEDDPKAIQRMAELRDLQQQLETDLARQLEPPWPRFAQLVRCCRDLATEAARVSGRDREELLDYVRAQERYADRAYQERNQSLYLACWQNLERYAGTLDDLCRAAAAGPPSPPAEREEEQARAAVEGFRQYLSEVWKQTRRKDRKDLEERLAEIARQGQGLSHLLKNEPLAALREARRWGAEVYKVETAVKEGRRLEDASKTTGLLEGML